MSESVSHSPMDDEVLPAPVLKRTVTPGGIPVYRTTDVNFTSRSDLNFDDEKPADNKVWFGPMAFDLAGESFNVEAYLNYGAEGQAYLIKNKTTGRSYVGKFCRAKDSPEINLIKQMPRALVWHPNFLTYELVVLNVRDKFSPAHHMILMEHVPNGELFEFIASGELAVAGKPVSEGTSRRFLQDVISGMAECYRFGITHRDLKPENLLLGEDGRIVIIDLGHAKRAVATAPDQAVPGEPEPFRRVTTTGRYGTVAFQAPEVCAGKAYDCELSDVWSVGAIAFNLRAKLPAFRQAGGAGAYSDMVGPDNAQFWEKIERSGRYNVFPPEMKKFINCMWRSSPEERPKFNQLESAISGDETILKRFPGLTWLAKDVNDEESFIKECRLTRPDKKFSPAGSRMTASELRREALLDMETSFGFMSFDVSTTTMTHFIGPITTASASVRERVALMVRANPWIAGKLVKGSKGIPELEFPTVVPDAEVGRLFEVAPPDLRHLSRTTPYDEANRLVSASASHVQTGKVCLQAGGPLTKVTLVPDDNGFILVFSMSHVIADGHTYYSCLNMLSHSAKVIALNPRRMHGIDPKQWVGEGATWAMRPGRFVKALTSMLLDKPLRALAVTVDASKVKVEKQRVTKEVDGVDFISSNDIIMATLGNLVRPRLMQMAVNFRGKLGEVCPEDAAGNYDSGLLYSNAEYATPAGIRRSLAAGPPWNPPSPLPGFFESATCRFLQVTSWASFMGPLEIEGCTRGLHLPKTIGLPWEMAVIFSPLPGQLAVLLTVYDDVVNKLGKMETVLGDPLAPGIFRAMEPKAESPNRSATILALAAVGCVVLALAKVMRGVSER